MYGGTKYRSTSTYVVLLYLPNLTWLSKLYPVWIQTLCVCKNAAPCTNREHSVLCILHNIDNQSVITYNVVDKVVFFVEKKLSKVRVSVPCKLYSGVVQAVSIDLLDGKSWGINRCENAAASSPICAECAALVSRLAEQQSAQAQVSPLPPVD